MCPLVLDFIKGKTGPDAFSLTKLLSPVVARVKGHGKVTMACEYNTRQCGSCHFDVDKHGDSSAKPRVCSTCHEADRSSLLFGKIHRSGVIQSTALSMLLVLGYLIVFAGVVMYVRRPAGKKEEEKPSGQQ